MRSVDLRAKAERIAARMRVVGEPDADTVERARNKGATRSPDKRQLLATLADAARERGREPASVAYF